MAGVLRRLGRAWPAASRGGKRWGLSAFVLIFPLSTPAVAQRVGENAVTQAEDAFGVSIGNERTGLYSESEVRGFSPIAAGNARLDGLYFDRQGVITGRLISGLTIKVGLSAQGYPFSAPTGVVDYTLRPIGASTVFSTLAAVGPLEGYQAEVDVQAPIGDGTLRLGAGASFRRDVFSRGDTADYLSRSLQIRIQPRTDLTMRVFWGQLAFSKDHATPFVFPLEPTLPAIFERRYYGQDWAQAKGYSEVYGTLVESQPGPDWRVRVGLFRANYHESADFADLFRNADAQGRADRLMIAEPPQDVGSTSGELRISRAWRDTRLRHVVHLSVRGRKAESDYGGAATASLGRAVVGGRADLLEPLFRFGARSHYDLEQYTVGLGYEGYWRGVGEASLGVQKTSYEKVVRFPNGVRSRSTDDPLLASATAALHIGERGALYGSYVRGLEESGTAPENATNFPEALPALRTWQRDFGVRWRATPTLRLVAGVFEVHKPYFNLDTTGRFVHLGEVANTGAEVSAAGEVAPGLTLLAGAVLYDPKIKASRAAGALGDKAVGLPDTLLRLNLDYRIPATGLSVDVSVSRTGLRYADVANRIEVPAFTTVDLGLRYRFKIGDSRATARAVVTNVGDIFAWRTYGSGAIQPIEPRRLIVSVAADF